MAKLVPATCFLDGDDVDCWSCTAENNTFVGLPCCYGFCRLAAGERPIAVGIILGQGTKQDEFMPTFPEFFNHGIGKVGAFVAANGYFHGRTSLLVVYASLLLRRHSNTAATW